MPSSTYGMSDPAADADVDVEVAVSADAIDFRFLDGSANGMLMRTETRTFSSGGSGVCGGFSVGGKREKRVSGRSVVGDGEVVYSDIDGGGSGERACVRSPVKLESENRDSLRGVNTGDDVGESPASGVVVPAGLREVSGSFSHRHATG